MRAYEYLRVRWCTHSREYVLTRVFESAQVRDKVRALECEPKR